MNFKNILIFRIGHLGDTLVSLPAFWAIKQTYPNAKLTLLSNADTQNPDYVIARNILPDKGLFDDWITYPTGNGKINRIIDSLRLLRNLRKRKFDAVFYLMTRNRHLKQFRRDQAFFKLAGNAKLIGTKYFEKNLLDFNRPRPLPRVETEIDFFLNCLEFENVPIPQRDQLKPELLLHEDEHKYAHRWLQDNCGKALESKLLIGVAPASKWASKVWAEERFAELIGRLLQERKVFPVIFGGHEDREKGERLLKKWNTGANAAGQLNIRQAAAALSRCKILIGNDSGTMHLAASVGTPCVSIFSAIDWHGRWEPFGENNIIFRTQIDCEGCHLQICPRNNECLDKITVEQIFKETIKLLN